MKELTNKKGFSLLELLLVVAIGAVLLLAGLAIYRNVTSNTNVNEANRLLNVIKQEVQRLYQGEGEYGTTTLNDVLINAEVVPSSALSGTNVRHPFNGTVTVTGNNETFTVLYEEVPQSACLTLGQAYGLNDPDFDGLIVDNTDPDADSNGEITVAELDTVCQRAGGAPDMTWSFF